MADQLLSDIRLNLKGTSTNESRNALFTHAQELCVHAEAHGLSTVQLVATVRFALLSGSSDRVTLRTTRVAVKLLTACVPGKGARLKHSAVQRIMGCLGSSPPLAEGMEKQMERKHKVDIKVQEAALKVLVCFMEPPSALPTPAHLPPSFLTPKARQTLAQSYAVLFHFLDYQTLRPHLCTLLCALTRRAHVKPYRIARLLSLRAQHPLDAPLSRLFSTYATFIPSLLFTASLTTPGGSTSKSSAVALLHGTAATTSKPVDAKWLSSVCLLHSLSNGASALEESPPPLKKPRLSARPTNATSLIASLLPPPTCHARGLAPLITEPRSPAALGSVLHRIVMPARMGAALLHTQARLALVAASAPSVGENVTRATQDGARIASLICALLDEELCSAESRRGGGGGKAKQKIGALVTVAEKTWSLIGLPSQASSWLSVQNRAQHISLLPLVALLPPAEWNGFYDGVLASMAQAARVEAKREGGDYAHAVLCALASMLERWGRMDWAKAKGRSRLTYYDATPLDPEVDYADSIRRTATFAAELAEELLATTKPRLSTQHAFLRLYETLSLPSLIGLHTILLPTSTSLFALLLSRPAGITTLSRLAGVIQRVRATFNAHEAHDLPQRALEELGELQYFTDANRVRLNDFVVVLADATWRFGKGLQSIEMGSFSVGFSASNIKHLKARCEERGSDLAAVASIMQGISFLTLAEAYANELARAQGHTEPIRGPITAGTIKESRKLGLPNLNEFRVGLLAHLEQQGIHGLVNLLRATMSSLNSAHAAAAAAAAASSSQS